MKTARYFTYSTYFYIFYMKTARYFTHSTYFCTFYMKTARYFYIFYVFLHILHEDR